MNHNCHKSMSLPTLYSNHVLFMNECVVNCSFSYLEGSKEMFYLTMHSSYVCVFRSEYPGQCCDNVGDDGQQ